MKNWILSIVVFGQLITSLYNTIQRIMMTIYFVTEIQIFDFNSSYLDRLRGIIICFVSRCQVYYCNKLFVFYKLRMTFKANKNNRSIFKYFSVKSHLRLSQVRKLFSFVFFSIQEISSSFLFLLVVQHVTRSVAVCFLAGFLRYSNYFSFFSI